MISYNASLDINALTKGLASSQKSIQWLPSTKINGRKTSPIEKKQYLLVLE
jgi:hypothetical protein